MIKKQLSFLLLLHFSFLCHAFDTNESLDINVKYQGLEIMPCTNPSIELLPGQPFLGRMSVRAQCPSLPARIISVTKSQKIKGFSLNQNLASGQDLNASMLRPIEVWVDKPQHIPMDLPPSILIKAFRPHQNLFKDQPLLPTHFSLKPLWSPGDVVEYEWTFPDVSMTFSGTFKAQSFGFYQKPFSSMLLGKYQQGYASLKDGKPIWTNQIN